MTEPRAGKNEKETYWLLRYNNDKQPVYFLCTVSIQNSQNGKPEISHMTKKHVFVMRGAFKKKKLFNDWKMSDFYFWHLELNLYADL